MTSSLSESYFYNDSQSMRPRRGRFVTGRFPTPTLASWSKLGAASTVEVTTPKAVVISTNAPPSVAQQVTEAEFHNSPDKIKVQILQSPNVAIVPFDDVGASAEQAGPLGEVVHYRRCGNGYSRDKKGRCRRIRRPGTQSPFDFSRLASNFAAKFRQASGEDSSLSESLESSEE